jgi:hypothetical protein
MLQCLRETPELAFVPLQPLLDQACLREPSLNLFKGWRSDNLISNIGTLSNLRKEAYRKDRTQSEIIKRGISCSFLTIFL